MLGLLKLTQILPAPLIGIIILGAVTGYREVWGTALVILIIDAVVGITLQNVVDRSVEKESAELQSTLEILKSIAADLEAQEDEEEDEDEDEDSPRSEKTSAQPQGHSLFDSFGESMTKEGFARIQKASPGFHIDFSYTKEKYAKLLEKEKAGEPLTTDEKGQLVLPLIFGSFGVTKDLGEAASAMHRLFDGVKNEISSLSDAEKGEQLHEFAVVNMLAGTIAAYEEEPVAATYHFMWALKTEAIDLILPWCDFIKCVLRELPPFVTEEFEGEGCGFSADEPMGSLGGTRLIAINAMRLISDLVGINGEIVVAKLGRTGMYGFCRRLGSTDSSTVDNMIDIYETYVIDAKYNIRRVEFYVNGYYPITPPARVRHPKGFRFFNLKYQNEET